MAFLNERKREHEQRCAEARKAGDFFGATRHAAHAADLALTLAERCEGLVARQYVEEAEAWLDAAEAMRSRASSKRPRHESPSSVDSEAARDWQPVADPGVRFADIAGMADAKQAIVDMIVTPLSSPEKALALGVRPGGGVLLFGPPGNGKTLLARAVAGELSVPFYSVTGAEIRSKWHGESEQRLRSLFQAVRVHDVAVLFLDEVEAFFPRRSEETPVDNRLITQFLAEVGGFADNRGTLLLLGATNRPWDIDDAVFRTGRFDRKIYLGPPDAAARREILARQLADVAGGEAIDLATWAKRLDGCTGSDIVGLVEAAKRRALRRCTEAGAEPKLTEDDLEESVPFITISTTPELLRQYDDFLQKRFTS